MGGDEDVDAQLVYDREEHFKAELEADRLMDDGIYAPVNAICECSSCRGEREGEARSIGCVE